jgi:hypothetical protein
MGAKNKNKNKIDFIFFHQCLKGKNKKGFLV